MKVAVTAQHEVAERKVERAITPVKDGADSSE
jgi:hypothetical protein